MRQITLCSVFVAALAASPAVLRAQDRPDAVLLRLTARDLGRIAAGALLPQGGNHLSGRRPRVSRDVSDLRYSAHLSDPRLELGDEGRATLNVEILEGNLRVGKIERRFLHRNASCEEFGADIEGGRPVDLSIGLRFVVDDGDLRIVPEKLELTHLEDNLQLVKPSRCDNTLLPRWMLWRIGRPRLKKQLANLDEVLLAKAIEGAAELNADEGLLRARWSDLALHPRAVETRSGSLLLAFAVSRDTPIAPDAERPRWAGPLPEGSFLALSESLLNTLVQSALAPLADERHRPRGSLRKLFRSEATYALVPGLRGIENPEDLFVTFRFGQPARVEIGEAAEPADSSGRPSATIRVLLAGVELILWDAGSGTDEARRLGTLEIQSAEVEARPYFNQLGGISFELLHNDWRLASRGIEFDDRLLSATLQELVFGELFETRHEPLGRGAFHVGPTVFEPRRFDRSGPYLVIALADQAKR